jgi:Second Messenger Oligonucleotide or Dinucleotide Synthetase domain
MTTATQHRMLPTIPDLGRNGLLSITADKLDMPEHLEKLARARYQEIADWLCCEDSPLAPYSPKVYSQGSFRLGTIIRPITDEDEFDIDLVCRLTFEKDQISQEKLKELIGTRLKQNYIRHLHEGRRCWTLKFEGFHIDVLPAIPNTEAIPNGILITDTKLYRWQFSNPIDYSKWFKQRQIIRFELERREMAKAQNVDIEKIPESRVKTPLQRAVQLLKRHRDGYFSDDADDQPISIIITTLAAKAYDNGDDLATTISRLVSEMGNHIEMRNGVAWVANPTDDNENFADKWQQHPQRKEKFLHWLGQVEKDMAVIAKGAGIHALSSQLEKSFGQRVIQEVLKSFGNAAQTSRQQGQLLMNPTTGILQVATAAAATAVPVAQASSVRVPQHHFYGDD